MRSRIIVGLLAGSLLVNNSVLNAQGNGRRNQTRSRFFGWFDRQAGGSETERVTRRVKLDRNGSVSVRNVSGDIVVTVAPGDEVSIDAVKHAHDRSELADVQMRIDETGGRVDIRTDYTRRWLDVPNISVDYTLSVPVWAAVELHSVSGNVRVTGVQGATRTESVSGSQLLTDTPKLQLAKSVSGRIELSGAGGDDITTSTVSGDLITKSVKAQSVTLHTISGRLTATDVIADRVSAQSISGDLTFAGAVTKGGRYTISSHSGSVHLTVTGGVGL